MTKRNFAAIIAIAAVFSLAGCGSTIGELEKIQSAENMAYEGSVQEVTDDEIVEADTDDNSEVDAVTDISLSSKASEKSASSSTAPIDQTPTVSDQTAGKKSTTSKTADSSSAETAVKTIVPETTADTETAVTEVQQVITETTETNDNSAEEQQSQSVNTLSYDSTVTASFSPTYSGITDTSDLFTSRDLLQTPDLSDAKYIEVSGGKTIDITEAGTYVISGSATDCTIRVNADSEAKVQLVLNGVSITNSDFPAIYVISADKCFVTTSGTENSLSVTGAFTADGDTNTDAVIFSKDDLVLNGIGTLNISSAYGNGITSKDDMKVTGGTYNITSAEDSLEANDTISICGGSFNISSSKDALHCENDEDSSLGLIYIADGTFAINAYSDGIQGNTSVQIDGGTFDITASEGIESTYVQINGGTIYISSSDDGINATQKSNAYSVPTIEFNGGSTTIVMGQGDTDAVDANGNIIVNGGTIDITAGTSSFDYDGSAQLNGGTVIVNGSEVSEIPQSMMGGGMRGGFGGDMGGGFDRRF